MLLKSFYFAEVAELLYHIEKKRGCPQLNANKHHILIY